MRAVSINSFINHLTRCRVGSERLEEFSIADDPSEDAGDRGVLGESLKGKWSPCQQEMPMFAQELVELGTESPRTSNTDADSIPELMGKDLGRRLLLAIPVPPLKGAPQACPEQDGRPSDQ